MTKKVCLSVCSGLLLLGSCSNDEFQPAKSAETSRDVGFNVINGKQVIARATTIDATNIADFNVYGYEAGASATSFITGLDPATPLRSANWDYGTPARWPAGDVVFNAYAPAAAVVKTTPAAGSLTTLNQLGYVVPAAMADQVDFLVAQTTQRWVPGNNKVTMNFKHALSKLLFKVKLTTPGTHITITDISLLNLLMEGTMDMNAAASTVAWTTVAGSELKDGSSNKVAWPVGYWSAGSEPSFNANNPATYQDVVDDDHAVMILPQATALGQSQYGVSTSDIAAALAGNKFYIAVTWDMGTVSRTSLCAVSNGANIGTGITFEPGKQYTFQFDLDAESDVITVGSVDVANMTPGVGDVMDANIGAMVGNVAWAKNNVGAPKTFAKDGVVGLYYQKDALVGWLPGPPHTGYLQDGTKVLGSYPTSNGATGAWTANPCPDGWRLPTKAEFIAMSGTATGAQREVNPDGNNVKWAELTMDAIGSKLRLPLVGYISNSGALTGTSGYFWVQEGTGSGYAATISSATGAALTWQNANTLEAYPVRCVRTITQP